MDEKDRPLLRAYLLLITLAGVPVLVLTADLALDAGRAPVSGRTGLIVVLFSVVLVAGELFPIPVTRGEVKSDEITVSSTFGFALMLVAPVFWAIAAQTLALVIDWRVHRRRMDRVAFNVGQYACSFAASRAAYVQVADRPFNPDLGALPDLTAALVAAAVFLVVNNGLVGVAFSIQRRVRLTAVLTGDLAWQLTTSAPLLGLGPLAAQAALWTPASVILLIIPIVALHRSGHHAMRREQEALRDALTGLSNRVMVTTSTERALRSATGRTALLLLDLDHFKEVNDTLGHGVGDELLIAVAARLSAAAAGRDLVGRLGGDEFVLVHHSCSADSAEALAQRLVEAVRQPYLVQGVTLTVGCSIGIALSPDHAGDVADLLRCADVAMYEAKETRGAYAFYDREGDRRSIAILGLQSDLRAALDDPASEQVYAVYQPQLDLASGRVDAVECLVRWRHPLLGELSPDAFVPMAENTSLIDDLMSHVLDLALGQARAWSDAGVPVTVAVNLSARHLSDRELPDRVAARLQLYGLAPERLRLEVTESRLMSDPERSVLVVKALHELGIGMSVDDFGTGYSSLAYLQQLAVDELKIDRSFVARLREPGDATIVRSTIDLGHNLGLRVVAEGVEHAWQVELLAAMGCDALQGFHVARPMLAEDASLMLGSIVQLAPEPLELAVPHLRLPRT